MVTMSTPSGGTSVVKASRVKSQWNALQWSGLYSGFSWKSRLTRLNEDCSFDIAASRPMF